MYQLTERILSLCKLSSSVFVLFVGCPQYEDALESPLEQCISDSMVRNKDSSLSSLGKNSLFSLVPSGVPSYKASQTISEESAPQPISSPDSFSDFFKVLGELVVEHNSAYYGIGYYS